jgi:hypothetical protein
LIGGQQLAAKLRLRHRQCVSSSRRNVICCRRDRLR